MTTLVAKGTLRFKLFLVAISTLLAISLPATAEISPGEQTLVAGGNAFGIDLYQQLRAGDGNQFFSPYSVSTALMMVRAGAMGATADQMTRTLHVSNLNAADLAAATQALAGQLSSPDQKTYQLDIANAMWGQVGATFLPQYQTDLKMIFSAELNGVDFTKPDLAAGSINQWVELKTNDRIKQLIDPHAINVRTKLILTNAIYFKGDWTQPFKASRTIDAVWTDGAPDGKAGKVAMMLQTAGFDYLKGDGFSALQMPYVGGNLAMLILLPDQPTGLPDLEKMLDQNRLSKIAAGLHHEYEVEVSFPKLKLETMYDLGSTLSNMGMPAAFSTDADLSGINGKGGLWIGAVVHKAFVQIDETGTEAAAATGVMVATVASMHERPVFNANHPFILIIRDIHSGAVLFIGRIVHPTK